MRKRYYIVKRKSGKWVVISPTSDGKKRWTTVGRKRDAERERRHRTPWSW